MRRRDRGLDVWPALTDLVAGIALLLTLALFYARSGAEGATLEIATLKSHIRELEAESDALRARISDLESKLVPYERADQVIGVQREQVRRVRAELERAGIHADLDEKTGTLQIPEKLLFARGKYELRSGSEEREKISAIGSTMLDLLQHEESARTIARIEVSGHTDKTGSLGFNLDLSRKRAAAIVDAWVTATNAHNDCVVGKLLPVGVGPTRPLIADETTRTDHECGDPDDPDAADGDARGCARNRRIEITIVPKDPERTEITGCP